MNDTVNVIPHIRFNDNGDIICGSNSHYAKAPRAKVVVVDVTDPERRLQPAEGTFVEARDGQKVSIGSAYCGTHAPSRRIPTLGVAIVADLKDSPAALLDYAKLFYEAKLDEAAAQQAEQRARHDEHRRRDHAEPVFTVRADQSSVRYGTVAAWLIEGTHPDVRQGEPYPMTNVEVRDEAGVLWVSTSDYMNSGPGRGNPSWTRAFTEALAMAAKVQEDGHA